MNYKTDSFFQLLVALVSASVLAEPEAEAQSTVDFEIAGGYGYGAYPLTSTEIIPLENGIPRYGGNLNTARSGFGLATIGGHYKKTISFGGYDGGILLSTVEEWDEDTEEWKLAPYSLEEGKGDFASLAVPPQMVCP